MNGLNIFFLSFFPIRNMRSIPRFLSIGNRHLISGRLFGQKCLAFDGRIVRCTILKRLTKVFRYHWRRILNYVKL